MPDEEETRLLAVLMECHRVSLAASDAFAHPVHGMLVSSNAFRH